MIDEDPIDIGDHEEKSFTEAKFECPVFKPTPVYPTGFHSPAQLANHTRLVIPYPPAANPMPSLSQLPLLSPPVRPATPTWITTSPTSSAYASSPPLAASSPLNVTCQAVNAMTHAPVSLSRLSVSPGVIKTEFAPAYTHKKFGKNKFGVMICDDTSSISLASPTALPPAPSFSPQSAWVVDQARLPSCDQPVELKPTHQDEQPRHAIPGRSFPCSTLVCNPVRPVRSVSVIMAPVSKIKY